MKHALIAAACLAAVASSANAQMRGPDPDLDRDGRVTLAEFKKARADSTLKHLDADRDGKVSRDEFKAVEARAKTFGGRDAGRRFSALFTGLDANGDGVVARREIEGAAARRFGRGDANGDGWLSKAELADMRQIGTRAD